MEERQHHRCAGERGQILPLVALLMAAAACAVLALGVLTKQTVLQARATAAADAAALAAASSGAVAADAVATANGSELVDFQPIDGSDVRVRIERDGVRATARARAKRPAPGTADSGGLTPAMRAAVRRAEALLGRPIPVSSGYRTPAHQQRLWQRRGSNRYPVARPGTSMHERGLAIDVPLAFVPTLLAVGAEAGLCRPLPDTDPVHFELCGEGFTARARG